MFTELLQYAGEPLSTAVPLLSGSTAAAAGELASELQLLLEARNGFTAYDGALHVLSSPGPSPETDLDDWNAEDGWKRCYAGMAGGLLSFAQDVFGTQYCIADSRVVLFYPETAEREPFAGSIREWVERVVAEPDVATGCALARAWQRSNRPLLTGERLIPITPFVLGGDFAEPNLRPLDAARALSFYGEIAVQIRDVPDGSSIRLAVTD